jgi:hypothetical protein
MPDFIQIGSHAYALTLNLFLTGFIGLLFSIVLFYWTRRIKREDEIKRSLIAAREIADKERHDAVIGSVNTLNEELGRQSKALFTKIDKFCTENYSEHAKMRRNFWKHTHRDSEIFIKDYEP